MGSTLTDSGLPEQITDRAIERGEQDRFGHEAFVARLIAIVTGAHPPVNVALFGRWGSGKSGICNRLAEELGDDTYDRFEFVAFDAFKFARLPLLRRFLIQLAMGLGGKGLAEKYRRRLYEREQRLRIRAVDDKARQALIEWVIRGLWIVGAIILLVDLLIWLLPAGAEHDFQTALVALLPALVPTSLLAAIAVFGARYLTTSTTSEAPSSEEQFDALFDELLNECGIGNGPGKRTLVVFIDELDRCSAVEVAETLESLKTFLDQPGCIFIVAADQKVLEHALTEQVRQSTPADLTNPYYSAGSAYLDKIFQFQLTLPPLYPGRLTGFALDLLEDVGGVWDRIDDKQSVVSILLPVGVRSPRRVKTLLNAFAQTLAIVLSRAGSHNLGDTLSRTDELAKLVGLQTEFPLFAADLAIHRDLPRLVLECANAEHAGADPESLNSMQAAAPASRARALGYARGEIAPDLSLDDRDSGSAENSEEEMRTAQGKALIDYLRQTSSVEGPRTDLVHLEGLGLPSGIDEGLAIELNDLVFKNEPSTVKTLLEGLDHEEKRRGFLRLLELVRESDGNDFDNAVRTCLISFSASDGFLPVGKDLLGAIARHDYQPGLASDELPGALEVAVAGKDLALQRSILERPAALNEPLRGQALRLAAELAIDHEIRLGEILAAEIVEDPDAAAERLSQ